MNITNITSSLITSTEHAQEAWIELAVPIILLIGMVLLAYVIAGAVLKSLDKPKFWAFFAIMLTTAILLYLLLYLVPDILVWLMGVFKW